MAPSPRAMTVASLRRFLPGLANRLYLQKAANREPELRLIPALCAANSLSVDVGANRGLYVNAMLPYSSRVVAFEPLPTLAQNLKKVYGAEVTIEQCALAADYGSAALRMPAGGTSWATIAPSNALELATTEVVTQEISTRPLDSFGLTDVGFLKIDVEGHEDSVVAGALETIRRSRPRLLIEIEERHNPGSVQRISATFHALDYSVYFLRHGELHSIADFSVDRDQKLTEVSTRGKTDTYINNFVFVPSAEEHEFIERSNVLLAAPVAPR